MGSDTASRFLANKIIKTIPVCNGQVPCISTLDIVLFLQMEDRISLRRFFLFANPGKPETFLDVEEFTWRCLEQGCQPVMEGWLHDFIKWGQRGSLDDLAGVDAIISFGGDGTLLRTVPQAARAGIPLLGVNLGHTGFLLEQDPGKMDEALRRLMADDFTIYERPLLSCQINDDAARLALNEVSLTRGQNPSSLVVDVFFENELVYTIHGDGVLVASPTGTTGYALSAGGPIICPGVNCHAVVPICSHILHQRPMVLPDSGTISLCVRSNRGLPHQLSLDGQIVLNLDTDSSIEIQKAREAARFICFSKLCFIPRFHLKQKEWSDNVYGGKR